MLVKIFVNYLLESVSWSQKFPFHAEELDFKIVSLKLSIDKQSIQEWAK